MNLYSSEQLSFFVNRETNVWVGRPKTYLMMFHFDHTPFRPEQYLFNQHVVVIRV